MLALYQILMPAHEITLVAEFNMSGEFCENLSSTTSQFLGIDPVVAENILFHCIKLSCTYIYFKTFKDRLSVSEVLFSGSPSRSKRER